ncbi:LPS translocon maturation chaperone LptM [Edaphovirga cremea]|uniref:LPS translocon maturation chaperone LptM n=1 Tax=Edaphovirga cremea TaxID=2267246 RepID=UPI000DEEE7D3|nr:lipoprotein [Edaphovirga cremea]
MRKELRWALTTVALIGLSGCGLKGPLYFPPAEKPKTEVASTDSANVQKNQQTTPDAQKTSSSAGM